MAKKIYVLTVNGYTHAEGGCGDKMIYDSVDAAANAFVCAIEDEVIRKTGSEFQNYRPECPKIYKTMIPDSIDIRNIDIDVEEEQINISSSCDDFDIVLSDANTIELDDSEKKVIYADVDENGYIDISLSHNYHVNVYSDPMEIIQYESYDIGFWYDYDNGIKSFDSANDTYDEDLNELYSLYDYLYDETESGVKEIYSEEKVAVYTVETSYCCNYKINYLVTLIDSQYKDERMELFVNSDAVFKYAAENETEGWMKAIIDNEVKKRQLDGYIYN